jgi:DNA phosphorothioation-associated DGQHR protein 1
MAKPFLTIPAIPVSQPIGEFFLCSIPAAALVKVSYSIPASMKREGGMFSEIFGNQRVKSEQRAKQIGAYIDETDSTFPNTIILSANYLEDGTYADEENLRWHAKKDSNGGFILTIPSEQKLASIIDGQHRLQGFKYVTKPDRLDIGLPCAVYINLPRAYQAKIFATININQKRVDKSLAYELFGYDLNESDSEKWPPDMLGVYLARILEGKEGSPFKDHVRLALLEEDEESEVGKPDEYPWEVSVACLVEGVTRLISEKPAADRSALATGKIEGRSELEMDNAPLREYYISEKDKSLLNLIVDYFDVAKEFLWKGQPKGTFITRTVGVLALFDVLRDALKEGQLDLEDVRTSTQSLFENVAGINFSDDFFHASGAGRVRIRKIIKSLSGLQSADEGPVKDAVNRLVAQRNKAGKN